MTDTTNTTDTTRALNALGLHGVYAYDNHSDHAGIHHASMAKLFDRLGVDHLIERTDELSRHRPHGLRGARCLDLGAGGGGFTWELAELVGPDGTVLATDLLPGLVPTDEHRVQVLRHDVTTEPLPPGPWHVIHSRLLLSHLGAH